MKNLKQHREHAMSRPAVCVIVPCFNERQSVPQLDAALSDLEQALQTHYRIEFVLVDDGSSDGTARLLHERFDRLPNYFVVEHKKNRGIAASIMTGLTHATAEICCSIDADCTYDPQQLEQLIPRLAGDVDVVVGSPYHRQGEVRGAPAWRIWLSRVASRVYRLLLSQKLNCYTSCFRVYRRSAVADIQLANDGFTGVVELLWHLDRRGQFFVEGPAVLETRRFGISKMRVARTCAAHSNLIFNMLRQRLVNLFVAKKQHSRTLPNRGRPRLSTAHAPADSMESAAATSPSDILTTSERLTI